MRVLRPDVAFVRLDVPPAPKVAVVQPNLDPGGHLAAQRSPVLLKRPLQLLDARPQPVSLPLRGGTPQLQTLASSLQLHAILPGAAYLAAKRANQLTLAAHHEVRDTSLARPSVLRGDRVRRVEAVAAEAKRAGESRRGGASGRAGVGAEVGAAAFTRKNGRSEPRLARRRPALRGGGVQPRWAIVPGDGGGRHLDPLLGR
mmetsp:Transcript_6298/g.25569  ORF Transcript_6298/g.25569 Transcript_6298/m.25569 type:complete len:201 (-) Transcript_6298:129-731(-)